MNSSSEDLWYVKLADGDVHRVTLDQLDEAFQAGHIDAETMVLASGSSNWSKLGLLLGLDEEEIEVGAPAPAAPPDPVAVAPPASAYSPQLEAPFASHPMSGVAHAAPAPAAPPASASGAVPAHAFPPTYTHTNHSTVRIAQPPHPASGPAATLPFAARPAGDPAVDRAPLPGSLRPVSVDSSDDFDFRARRRGGKAKWVVALLVVAGLGAAAAVAVVQRPGWAQPTLNRLGLHGPSAAQAVSAALTPADPAPTPTPAATPAPSAAPEAIVASAPSSTPGAESPLSPNFGNQPALSEDQKKRLADADKKAHSKKSHGGGASHAGTGANGKSKSTTFTTGGSKYDPLNSSI